MAFGKFHLVSKSFQKGTWLVYQAVEVALERPVELRLHGRFLEEGSPDEALFIRRSRALAELDHAHILSVLDFGIEDRKGYITAPPREAASLQFMFAQGELAEVDLDARLASGVALLDALETMHAIPMVHGAVAADTVFWDRKRGFAYFAWFPVFEDAATEFSCQVVPLPSGFDGVRADLYRLGAVLHRLLTGVDPAVRVGAPGDSAARCPDGTGSHLEAFLTRALTQRPDKAYQTAAEAKADLARARHVVQVASALSNQPEDETREPVEVVPETLLSEAVSRQRDRATPPPPATSGLLNLAAVIGAGVLLFVAGLLAHPLFFQDAAPRAPQRAAAAAPAPPRPATPQPPRPAPKVTRSSLANAGALRPLEGAGPTGHEDFLDRWGKLRNFVLAMPPRQRRQVVGYRQLVELRRRFARDPDGACASLDGFLGAARGYRPPPPGAG